MDPNPIVCVDVFGDISLSTTTIGFGVHDPRVKSLGGQSGVYTPHLYVFDVDDIPGRTLGC